jgi:hypothetical protein
MGGKLSTPGGNPPLEALAKAIAQHAGAPTVWEDWHGRLQRPHVVDEVAKLARSLGIGESSAAILLLPIDQFEEVFMIAESTERAAFVALLAAVLDPQRGLPVMAVAAKGTRSRRRVKLVGRVSGCRTTLKSRETRLSPTIGNRPAGTTPGA